MNETEQSKQIKGNETKKTKQATETHETKQTKPAVFIAESYDQKPLLYQYFSKTFIVLI